MTNNNEDAAKRARKMNEDAVRKAMEQMGYDYQERPTTRRERSKFPTKGVALTASIFAVLACLFIFGGNLFTNRPESDGLPVNDSLGFEQDVAETQATEDELLFACLDAVQDESLSASDADFYPRLIAEYNAEIGCLDKYPNAKNEIIDRGQLVINRDSAVASAKQQGVTQQQLDAAQRELGQSASEPVATNNNQGQNSQNNTGNQNNAYQEKIAKCDAWKSNHGGKIYTQVAVDDAKYLKDNVDELRAAADNIREMMKQDPDSKRLSDALTANSAVLRQAQSAYTAEVNKLTTQYKNESGC